MKNYYKFVTDVQDIIIPFKMITCIKCDLITKQEELEEYNGLTKEDKPVKVEIYLIGGTVSSFVYPKQVVEGFVEIFEKWLFLQVKD